MKGGKIFVKWRRENNAVILEVKADEGVNYEICVPDGVQSAVKNGNDTVATIYL